MKTTTLGGAHYFMLIINDFSHKVWVYLLAEKSEALHQISRMGISLRERDIKEVQKIRSDNGGEFISQAETKSLVISRNVHFVDSKLDDSRILSEFTVQIPAAVVS